MGTMPGMPRVFLALSALSARLKNQGLWWSCLGVVSGEIRYFGAFLPSASGMSFASAASIACSPGPVSHL